jgi:hypothetical protein
MHCPVAKSFLAELCPLFAVRCACCGLLLLFAICARSSSESDSESSEEPRAGFFFLLVNSDGKGLLSDRPCCGLDGRGGFRCSSSEELETYSSEPSRTSRRDKREVCNA